ncbi:hypothetical protein [Spirosoma montaniterrae]|uniref:Uncharacterized protein n=1 Tax=Spirosoma montaniterrae TaxID=1178516 RepID=A0A1P9WXM0_9BACT|nr:hypothetical protein [Spirosoma montaniterrae]AQG80142.1 hypothetical protein AWR27_12915 [Spirosoma montaniterrae]
MEKRIIDKINALKGKSASREELMRALAQIDENGQLTAEAQAAIDGGKSLPFEVSRWPTPILIPPIAGMLPPREPFPGTDLLTK